MTEKLLVAPHSEMIAIMGAGHAAQVKKFLENPKLRARYRALVDRRLR